VGGKKEKRVNQVGLAIPRKGRTAPTGKLKLKTLKRTGLVFSKKTGVLIKTIGDPARFPFQGRERKKPERKGV